ncbi:GGDEF domain-containing protein [Limisalsivibrio acetivorans]|uniref:GGDEF domain-containing protein n=1 Tax=Limisalsivibrio acetivorans TaxID=1304888 RepID=UPI0003B4FA46|nr:GGDEF domain-containing protein [Limisalsivibrio acetivorans]
MLPRFWQESLDKLDHAFQPLVNPFSGVTFAVEALLRNYEQCGFESVGELFDRAYRDNVLFELDLVLRSKAMVKFKTVGGFSKMKLMYNYDERTITMPDFVKGRTFQLLQENGLEPDSFCFEISERGRNGMAASAQSVFENARTSGCRIALDDFGAGFANFELFYYAEPNFIKIDRFLIQDIDTDIKKKKYCSHIVSMAHFFGISVIAEGVETRGEFFSCKEVGFDIVQGFFIQRPTLNSFDIKTTYSSIQELDSYDKRDLSEDAYLISNEIVKLSPVNIKDKADKVLSAMREHMDVPVVPVTDDADVPVGIISEKDLKEYLYMPYGKELLNNRSLTVNIRKFVSRCPIVEINVPIEKILELFVSNKDADGVIITKGLKYFGFLTAQSLLNTLNEKNLAFARDMNPLTKLPGNNLINAYLNDAFKDGNTQYFLIYFDFDNFKPFNDRFGFRQGDRAIILFSDILKKDFSGKNEFIGHVGGDDFFGGMSCSGMECSNIVAKIKKTIRKFTDSVVSFYTEDEVDTGHYTAKDRSGNIQSFNLLSVSAAIIELPPGDRAHTPDQISNILADLKKQAKASDDKIAIASMGQKEITIVKGVQSSIA